MSILTIKELSAKQTIEKRLKDISKNISFAVALSSGMIYKSKMECFYKIIAKELKELIDSGLLQSLTLYKFHNHYLRVTLQNKSLCFLKNNIFTQEEKLSVDNWLDQRFVYLENQELPDFLSTKEKEELIQLVDGDLEAIIIRNYSRQELNSDKYLLTLNNGDKPVLLRIFRKYNYYDINVRKYIEIMASNFDYSIESNLENKQMKTTYNNYILELGSYISREIDDYLNKGII
ncbi:MAG: hypothetical protein HFJ12_05670 [Bacilli bacterium]|nr:hypothetical protein [Bacilli bacterium]